MNMISKILDWIAKKILMALVFIVVLIWIVFVLLMVVAIPALGISFLLKLFHAFLLLLW